MKLLRSGCAFYLLSIVAGVLLWWALFAMLCRVAGARSDDTLDLPLERPAPAAPPVARHTVLTKRLPPEPPPPPPPPPEEKEEKPPTIYGARIVSSSRTVVFVLDRSKSMEEDVAQFTDETGAVRSGDRLDRAKAELRRVIGGLGSSWRFNVVAYDCNPLQWRKELARATPGEKLSAIRWVNAIAANGATGTGPTVVEVLKGETDAIALLTDGMPNCEGFTSHPAPERHRELILVANAARAAAKRERARIDVFGIGALGPFKQFCMDVAADNGGSYCDVR